MIYFDNSATGGFKPNASIEKAHEVMKYLSANPGRSGHRLSLVGATIVEDCRQTLAEIFNSPSDRIIFTKNCTEALNVALFGLINDGDHVITTVYEHNSVLRPLHRLEQTKKIEVSYLSPTQNTPFEKTVENAISPNTKVIVTTGASNLTGEVLPIKKIGEIAKKHNLVFIVDGAQAGGHIPINMKDMNIDVLCLAGHKGLYGIMGSGVLLFNNKVEISPLLLGGTGSQTFSLTQPTDYPERLESGTLNLPAIASLKEGVTYSHANLDGFSKYLYNSTKNLISLLKKIKGLKIYSNPNPIGIVSFAVENSPSNEVADILSNDYDIAVRGGFHCAPLIHKFLKTDGEGLVRVSLCPQNTTREIEFFVKAVSNICNGNY